MSVDSKHPLYSEFAPDWVQLRDTYRGERQVKEKKFEYLPPTSGMVLDGVLAAATTAGAGAYTAYLARAVLPEVVREAVEAMLGVMHHQPPAVELPAKLEPLRDRITLGHESIDALLRRINEEQLITGRLGLLLEVPDGPGAQLPYVALYQAEDIINWDDGTNDDSMADALNLVVLDETEPERQADFDWKEVTKHRVLVIGDGSPDPESGAYGVGVFKDDTDFSAEELTQPSIAGTTIDEIPFKFVNTKDITPQPDDAPLLGLSNLSLTIFRGEADYRQGIFMQGQDTLVVQGGTSGDGPTRIGAGAEINVPAEGDAKFIGTDSAGLEEMRLSLVNDYQRAESKAKGLLEAVSSAAESGEALRVRVAARTASLNQIALAGAFALQELLRIAAKWVGANPEEVIVTPNLDFVSDTLAGETLVQYMTAKGLGAPLTLQDIHAIQVERGLTTKTWDEYLAQAEEEAALGLPGAMAAGDNDDTGSTNADGPEDEEDLEDEDEGEDDGE